MKKYEKGINYGYKVKGKKSGIIHWKVTVWTSIYYKGIEFYVNLLNKVRIAL